MLPLKPSQGKHDQDIPEFNTGNTLTTFFNQRRNLLSTFGKVSLASARPPQNPRLQQLEERACGNTLFKEEELFLFKLEKAFVVKGTIDHLLETEMAYDNYLLLASCLLYRYEYQEDLNALNTAIRLLDFVAATCAANPETISPQRLCNTVERELRALEALLP